MSGFLQPRGSTAHRHVSPDLPCGVCGNFDLARPEENEPMTFPRPGQQLALASASPRRKEILAALDYPFHIIPPTSREECSKATASPAEIAKNLALAKAMEVAPAALGSLIVAADTLVVFNGQVFGKPSDPTEAETMLLRLRGRTHQVVTGLAVADSSSERYRVLSKTSSVTMRPYIIEEIRRFVASGNSLDKAGAYAVQDPVFKPALRVEGCYLNVVGLPLCTLVETLKELGLRAKLKPGWRPTDECRECPLLEHLKEP